MKNHILPLFFLVLLSIGLYYFKFSFIPFNGNLPAIALGTINVFVLYFISTLVFRHQIIHHGHDRPVSMIQQRAIPFLTTLILITSRLYLNNSYVFFFNPFIFLLFISGFLLSFKRSNSLYDRFFLIYFLAAVGLILFNYPLLIIFPSIAYFIGKAIVFSLNYAFDKNRKYFGIILLLFILISCIYELLAFQR